MNHNINCIMLVDDNFDDNFFHERVIRKSGFTKIIISKQTASEALEHLKLKRDHIEEYPNLIFLDINMPGMNGWDFLAEYSKLDKDLQSTIVITMLTTSENPDDKEKLAKYNIVSDFKTKPITVEMLNDIINKYFRLKPPAFVRLTSD